MDMDIKELVVNPLRLSQSQLSMSDESVKSSPKIHSLDVAL
jgi:hypothetical protein